MKRDEQGEKGQSRRTSNDDNFVFNGGSNESIRPVRRTVGHYAAPMIAPGTSLLHYRVVEKIGEGGMGAGG